MYGASFDCGLDKTGDNQVLKFYIESINDNFLPKNGEKLLNESIKKLLEIIFNPYLENKGFKKEYVEQEKDNLRKKIESRKDNKEIYAFNRCIEEMFKNDPYGIYKNGYIEELDKINEKSLFDYYKKMIENCRIDVMINGKDANEINVSKEDKKDILEVNKTSEIKQANDVNIVNEKADVTQGKLIIGMNTPADNKFAISMYNAILGGGANSKLFQNVREKASLAYSAGSKYIRRKDAIIIVTGIELQNYEKTLKIIKQQIEDMKSGNISDDEFDKAKQLIIASLNSNTSL